MRVASLSLGCALALSLTAFGCGGDDPSLFPSDSTTGSGAGGAGGAGGAETGSGGSTSSSGMGGAGGMGGMGGMGGGEPVCTPEGPFDGEPITAPPGAWTWVGVPGAMCRTGSLTGFGVRLNPASDKLMIYLEGGGACFNGLSCVANPGSFGEGNFDGWKSNGGQNGIFDPENAENPARDWNAVYIPYCTGDVHAGDATGMDVPGFGSPQDQAFVGYANIGLFLRRIIPTFPDVTEVLLTGVSAGGFGAAYNYDRVAQAFCPRAVHLVDDSGPPMADAYLAPCLQQRWRDLWGIDATLPADCADCSLPGGGGIVNYTTYIGAKYTNSRLGLVSSDRDNVITAFYGYGQNDCDNIDGLSAPMSGDMYAQGLADLRDNHMMQSPIWATYYIGATQHTYLGGNGLYSTTVDGVDMTTWVATLSSGGDAGHVGP